MDKITVDTYNKLAREYDEETRDFWKRFPSSIIKKFAEQVTGKKKVLDLGSGPGRDGLLLVKEGLDVSCLDASLAMVQMCKEKGLQAVEGDFLNIPIKDDEIDGVWAYTSLLHTKKENMEKALGEIKRVLKPGGVLDLGLIEGERELYRESSGVEKPRWFAFYTDEEIRNLLEKTGFEAAYFEDFVPKSKRYLNYLAKSV